MVDRRATARLGTVLFGICALVGCSEESTGAGGGGGGGTTTTSDPGPRCVGTPKPCAERSPFDCLAPAGCNDNGVCTGQAAPCGAYGEEAVCGQHLPCTWMPTTAACVGPEGCSGSQEQGECEQLAGCTWEVGVCGGEAAGCSTFTIDLCASEAGCAWQSEGCNGYAYDCSTFLSESTCYVQTGCNWE